MGQQEWLANFRKQNGREPNLEEFSAAKQNGFSVPKPVSSATDDLKAWVQVFENRYQRKPTLDEVQQHKAAMAANAAKQSENANSRPAKPVNAAAPKGNQARPRPKSPADRKPAQVRPKPRKKKALIIFILALLLVLFGLVIYGYRYFSYENSLARTTAILNSYDSKQYQQVSVWSDNDRAMSADDLQPLANYVKDQNMSKAELSRWIKQSGKGVSFVQDGRTWLIFPRYVLKFNPINLEVNTNKSGLTVSVNDHVLTDDSDDDYSKLLKRQAPGLYQFSAKGQVDGHKVKAQNSGYYGGTQFNSIDLDIDSNTDSNDKNDSNADNLSKDTAQSILSQMADLLTSVGHSTSSSVNPDDVYQNGDDNHAFKDFKEMIDHNLHSARRNADNITFSDINVNNVNGQPNNRADVEFDIKEDFYFSPQSDSDKHTSGTLTQRYRLIAHMVYNKDKNRWLVDSIDSNQKKLSESDNIN